MLDGGDILASDAERQQAILHLHDACGEGRLTLDEFSERVKDVFTSRTRGQLAPITADLPRSGGPAPARRAASRRTLALLSEVKRRGRWYLDGETTAISILGSCILDLRQAVIRGEEVVVDAHAILGSVKIIVSPGTQVELEGLAILGSRASKVDDEPRPGAPSVRVRGLTLLGDVQVVAMERAPTAPAVTRAEGRVDRPELLEG